MGLGSNLDFSFVPWAVLCAVVEAKLAEWSFQTPEDRVSNPFRGVFLGHSIPVKFIERAQC